MKQIKRQLLNSFALITVSGLTIIPTALAIDFTFTTVQERSSEVVEIDNVGQNFRELQQERLDQAASDSEPEGIDNNQSEAVDDLEGQADALRLNAPADEATLSE